MHCLCVMLFHCKHSQYYRESAIMATFKRKSLSLLIIFLFLAGCVTLPSSDKARNIFMPWDKRKNQLEQIKNWQLRGLVGVTIKKKSESVYINWQQKQGNYTVNLFGPLNFGAVVLHGAAHKVTLQTADGNIFTANSAEELLTQVFGWCLPISNLKYWIFGLSVPYVSAQKTFDKYNHLQSLKQQGWQVEYLLYTAVNGIDLPSKIIIRKEDLRVKFIISKWSIFAWNKTV